MRGQPDFKVVSLGAGKAHIAGAQQHGAIRQFQFLQNGFRMQHQLLMRLGAFFRVHDLHHFHLVELMLANHAARVLAITAGLGAEAGAVADEFQRQIFRLHNRIAHKVGNRIFGGGDQIKIAPFNLEQIFLELGKAGHAVSGFRPNHVRHIDFGVAVLQRMRVEHELCKRPMQPRHAAAQH